MVKTFISFYRLVEARNGPRFGSKNAKTGPYLLLWLSEGPQDYQEMLNIRDFARREEGDVRFGGLLSLHHGERDLLAVAIDLLDPYLDCVTNAHHVAGVLDKAVG